MSTCILRLAPAHDGKRRITIMLVNQLLSCHDAGYSPETQSRLVVPACSNLRQPWFSNTLHIHTSASPTASGLALSIFRYTKRDRWENKESNRSFLSTCSSTQMIYTGSSSLDFHYTQSGSLVGWSTSCSTRFLSMTWLELRLNPSSVGSVR